MSKLLTLFLLLSSLLTGTLYAQGTIAGTSVDNQAEILYMVGGIEYNLTTNKDIFIVDQIIDLDISWQDTTAIEVGANEEDRVLTFILTNLGNGEDTISLSYDHNVSSNFLPQNAQIFQDTNGNGFFDLGGDTQVNDLNLSADTNTTLFIVSDIPDDNATVVGAYSYDAITALSTSSATVGVDRQEDVDLVVRTDTDRAEGAYVIRDYWLVSQKSVVVHSDNNETHTGTIITYSIDLSIGGNASGRIIGGVVLRDTIPIGTTYQIGTLQLDGMALTDIVDADKGAFIGNEVRVEIGTLSGSIHHVLMFDVQVK